MKINEAAAKKIREQANNNPQPDYSTTEDNVVDLYDDEGFLRAENENDY